MESGSIKEETHEEGINHNRRRASAKACDQKSGKPCGDFKIAVRIQPVIGSAVARTHAFLLSAFNECVSRNMPCQVFAGDKARSARHVLRAMKKGVLH
jgi:hypothetical protein